MKNKRSFFVIKVGDLYVEENPVGSLVLSKLVDKAYKFQKDSVYKVQRKISSMMVDGIKDIKIIKVLKVTETFEEEYRLENKGDLTMVKVDEDVIDEKMKEDLRKKLNDKLKSDVRSDVRVLGNEERIFWNLE